MILKSVRITNFQCIEDSTTFSTDRVTCLVGKNEAGKSALLQSLYKLNPDVPDEANFDEVEEYPRRHLSVYQEKLKAGGQKANVLVTTWELTPAEQKLVADAFGLKALEGSVVTIEKGYDNSRRWTLALNEASILEHLAKASALQQDELKVLKGVKTISAAIEKLTALQTPTEHQTAFKDILKKQFPDGSATVAAAKLLKAALPTFLYFANYRRLPGQIAMEEFSRRKQNNQLTLDEKVFLALLSLAGTTPEEIQSIGKFEPFNAKLESVSNRLSDVIFKYWSQNKHLQVEFRFDAARPQDSPPFHSGHIFRTRIRNNRHKVTVGFDERSTGFVWFFSFLVWFSQVRQVYGDNLIILLDEPGLSLHAKAQEDLLRYFDEQLKPNYQVIYTTHSPFMINPEDLLCARTVEDVVLEDDTIEGTKVGEDVLSTDADTVFPLQACLGYDIAQTLFVGKNTLLVEGASDLLYLKWFSRELERRGRQPLDKRWVIAPSGGIDKVVSFLTLFAGKKLHVAVFADHQQGHKAKLKNLRESELLRAGHVFTADMYANQAEADTEDVIGRAAYVYLVNECFRLKGTAALPDTKPNDAPLRVVEEVKTFFATLPVDSPLFDHYVPAEFLTEHGATLRDSVPELGQALDRFERLFSDLNKLLTEPSTTTRKAPGGKKRTGEAEAAAV